MTTVDRALARLLQSAEDGTLGALAERFHLEVIGLFGGALDRPDPGDIDVAIGFVPGAPRDLLGAVNALMTLVPGDHLDVMDLDRAEPVAARAATDHWRVLFQADPVATAEREIKAFMMFEDSRPLRRLQREALLAGCAKDVS